MNFLNQYEQILLEPSLTCIRTLGQSIQQREDFSKCFLDIMIECHKELEGIKTLTKCEIDATGKYFLIIILHYNILK